MTTPLHKLTTQESDLVWNENAETFFYKLKYAMSKPPILPFPNANKTLLVHTNASKYSLGAVLMRRNTKSKMVTVQYASRSIT